MKKIITLTFITILLSNSFAQSFEQQISNAEQLVKNKEYCKASEIFKSALKDKDKGTKYDYYYASISSANCGKDNNVIELLGEAQKRGLGLQDGEIEFIKKDDNFAKLHGTKEWDSLIDLMQQKLSEKKIIDENRAKEWISKIKQNAINQRKSKFDNANSGFALYYSSVENLKIPYLVNIPKNYNPKKPTKVIFFLHGGIKNTERFNHDRPEISGEPIFNMSDKYNAIIVYPFGKKDFGWVNQKKAFENIYTILQQVQNTYNVDKKKIYLGGMSNGGTATFWFASKKPNIFAGFYAFSANPILEIEKINFNFDKPFYEIHAKDDQVFKFDDVEKIYNQNKSKNWHFISQENGGHSFIYQENGSQIIGDLLDKLINKKNGR